MNDVAAIWAYWLRKLAGGDGLRAQLLRGGIGSLAVKAAHAGLAFTVAVVLARLLGPEGYGVYSFAWAVLMLTALPAQVGIPQLVVRETAKAQTNEDWGLIRGLWRWANVAVLVCSALAVLAVAFLLLLMGGVSEGGRAATVATGIALIPLIALAFVRAACVRGLHMVVWGQLPESIFRPALLLMLVGVWLLVTSTDLGLTPEVVMGLHVLAAVVTFVLGGLLLWRVRPNGVKGPVTPRYYSAAWRRAVLPLALIAGLQLINNYADLIILGLLRSDEEVGIYRAVFQVALLVIFGLQAINQVLQPHFARLYERGEKERLQRLLITSARTNLALALPPVLVFLAFGSELLEWFFGEEFRMGAAALAILAAGQVINAGMGSMGILLNMTGHEKDTAIVLFFSAVTNIVLNVILIPNFGLEGAATATAASMVMLNVALWFLVAKRLNMSISVSFKN